MHTPANIFSKSAHLMHTPREKLPKYGGIFKKYNNKKLPKNEESPVILGSLYVSKDTYYYGPSDWNRTSGLLNPIQARYQSAPHPDI